MASLRLLLTGVVAAGALSACSGDTAILLRVTRDATVPATVPRLHVLFGVRAGDDITAPASTDPAGTTIPTYVDDDAPTERIDTSGADLMTSPYEVILRPSAQLGAATGLELAAAGFASSDLTAPPIAWGAIGHEVHFHQGDTLVYEVTLSAVGSPTADPGRRDCGLLAGATGSIYACTGGCVELPADDGTAAWIGASDDYDCDGDPHGTDCNDYDWAVNHKATDLCNNGIDDDCNGTVDDGVDLDGDGFTPCQGDCVDNPSVPGSAKIHPGAVEDPHNGVDDNCNGMCDENDDVDGDTYTATGFRTTNPSSIDRSCAAAVPDCNDHVATINPGAPEIDGNGFDDDCNGVCDTDADGDGYTAPSNLTGGTTGFLEPPAAGTAQCAPAQPDCDDDPADVRNGTPAAQIHPGAPELCDGVDDNCNGQCDEGLDTDGDHFTVCGTVNDGATACTYVGSATCPGNGAQCDCAEGQPNIYPRGPGPELCDGYDESCDGVLYPKDTPCFALDANQVCTVGSRQCDDTTPPGGFGSCVLGTQPAPDNACSAFAACQTSQDPIACMVGQLGNAQQAACVATLDGTEMPPELCPVPPASYVAPLPMINGTTTCAAEDWAIVGGEQHGTWKVGLVDAATTGGGPGPTVGGTCAVDLVVESLGGGPVTSQPPPPVTLFVIAHRVSGSVIMVVDLSGSVTGTACPSGPAMQCHFSG